MSIKSKRKGFTIVELVIVIAVIAILAAVLIPVFAGLINKAELSADQALVRNLNTSLALSSGAGEKQNETMYDTLEDIKKAGYVVENLTPTKNGNEILWDKQENQFVLVIKNKDGSVKEYYTGTTKCDYTTVENSNFWKIYKEMPTGQKYSIYLAGNEFVGTVDVFGVGFDAGLNKVSVNYFGGETKSSVIIRTYFGDLTVDAETDDVKHYGIAKNLTVKNVNKENCYHEYGFIDEVKTGFVSGKFVAEKTSVFHQSRADVESALAVAENENKSFDSKLGVQYGEHYFVNNKCVFCDADITPSKNGLSNGLYYENGELKTGSVTDEETGKTYTFEDGILVLKADDSLESGSVYKITHKFDKSSVDSKYLTDKVKLIAHSAICGNPGNQNLACNYLSINFDKYSVENAKVYSPNFYNKFTSTPWTTETIKEYLKLSNETCGNSEYTDASALPFYIQGKDYDGYNSLSKDVKNTLTFSEYLKLKYRNNLIVTGESSAISAYFVKADLTEKTSAYAYKNDEQGVGLVIGSDGKIYGYAWSETNPSSPVYQEIKTGSNSFKDAFAGTMNYTIERTNNCLIIKYNGKEIEKLNFTLSEINNYNLAVEKENINGKSIYDECSSEELLAFVTMPGDKTEIKMSDDPEIAELYLKAFWNQYYLKINNTETKILLENVDKDILSNMDYYMVYFTNGIGNSYQNMEHIGPVVEILTTKNA